jgi:hypothetical protein
MKERPLGALSGAAPKDKERQLIPNLGFPDLGRAEIA